MSHSTGGLEGWLESWRTASLGEGGVVIAGKISLLSIFFGESDCNA
ncbi:hypothetical protein [Azospirillum doebereinerae]